MQRWPSLSEASKRPLLGLTVLFCVWKVFLLAIVSLSPGIGYDTSADIYVGTHASQRADWLAQTISRVERRLTSWDALYYVEVSTRDYRYEQEWAFSWGYTRLVSITADVINPYLPFAQQIHKSSLSVWTGLFYSNVAHLLSVFVLYYTTLALAAKDGVKIAFISACLHITSTAGVFLSAPYSESLFALLNMTGVLLFTKAWPLRHGLFSLLSLLLSGVLFSLATSVRSNGLLSGGIFLPLLPLLWLNKPSTDAIFQRLIKTAVVGVAGLTVSLGLIFPQWHAYNEYCSFSEKPRRPSWCSLMVPSIFAWVQSHYWNVGFLKYWTVSNIPLFALAAPMLYVLTKSSVWAFREAQTESNPIFKRRDLLPIIAIPQLLLAATAFTSYHVQIILRLASGYPLWYWWIAQGLFTKNSDNKETNRLIRWMIIYPLIQAALFASFLPPA